MANTKAGGKKTAMTNKAKYGADYYAVIGAKGGKKGRTGGFYANRELARLAGQKGGRISRRGMGIKSEVVEIKAETVKKPFWSSLLYRSR